MKIVHHLIPPNSLVGTLLPSPCVHHLVSRRQPAFLANAKYQKLDFCTGKRLLFTGLQAGRVSNIWRDARDGAARCARTRPAPACAGGVASEAHRLSATASLTLCCRGREHEQSAADVRRARGGARRRVRKGCNPEHFGGGDDPVQRVAAATTTTTAVAAAAATTAASAAASAAAAAATTCPHRHS